MPTHAAERQLLQSESCSASTNLDTSASTIREKKTTTLILLLDSELFDMTTATDSHHGECSACQSAQSLEKVSIAPSSELSPQQLIPTSQPLSVSEPQAEPKISPERKDSPVGRPGEVGNSLSQEHGPSPDMGPDDIVIAVMGVTGVGKTSFIQELTPEKLKIGESLSSCTVGVSSHRCEFPGYGKIWLIDTPGFDDTYRTDAEILARVASFLTETYEKKIYLTGIIYLHRIQDPRAGHAIMRNIRTFKKLCGKDGLSRTVFVTTFWKYVGEEEGKKREEELLAKSDLWRFISERGGKAFRYLHNKDSAKRVVEHILETKLGKGILSIQKDMGEDGLALKDTEAGKEVDDYMEKLKEHYENEIQRLRQELKEVKADKDKEFDALRAIIQKQKTQMENDLKRYQEDHVLLSLKKDGLKKRIRSWLSPVLHVSSSG